MPLFPIRRAVTTSLTPYRLYDAYLTALAAGSVNNTLSEPKGHRVLVSSPAQLTRVVVADTGSNISIANNALTFAGGASNWSGTVFRYGSFGRIDGRGIACDVTPSSLTQKFIVGWTNTATPTALTDFSGFGFGLVSGRISIMEGSATVDYIPFTADSTYTIYAGLREGVWGYNQGGVMGLIKGGEYPYWRYIGKRNSFSDTTMYPVIASYDGVFKVANFRIPQRPWMAKPWVSDGWIAGSDNAGRASDGNAHVEGGSSYNRAASGGDGIVWGGNAGIWTVTPGSVPPTGWGKITGVPTLGSTLTEGNTVVGQSYKIITCETDHFFPGNAVGQTWWASSEKLINALNSVQLREYTDQWCPLGPIPSKDYGVAVNSITTANGFHGLFFNADDPTNPSNVVVLAYNGMGSQVSLKQCVAGTWTQIGGPWSVTYRSEVPFGGSITDGALTPYWEGDRLSTPIAVTPTGNYCGVWSNFGGASVECYEYWANGKEGQYSWLYSI